MDRDTQLTGRPRMPQRSLFGLHLSDKSDPNNPGESWWKQMLTEHRAAGYAFDHRVNDNAWRASNEAVSGQKNSWFDWRADRFPDPAEYKRWCDENGVTVTLDLNRPGIPLNPSWNNGFSIRGTNDCPDFTNPDTRQWIWDLFFDHAFNPAIGDAKRPYFWSRGITAGAQRWGAHWSGDLNSNWGDMTYQVRALQSSGLSGFPYFNHDAGGHFNVTVNEDNLYRQWDMAFGSFTPIWKPHGPGHKRWPLQRTGTCQATAHTYIAKRYEMIPYIYSYARIAQATGVPMARPMFMEDQHNDTAWEKDLQYYWGKEMLVAPNCSDGNNDVSVWLPEGDWYDFWDDTLHNGGTTEDVYAATGDITVFVRAGAVIPMAPFATSTFFIPNDILMVHVYVGADGSFTLYEDDGVSEKFRTQGESRATEILYTNADLGVALGAADGTYDGAPSNRSYQVVYHGLSGETDLAIDGSPLPPMPTGTRFRPGRTVRCGTRRRDC